MIMRVHFAQRKSLINVPLSLALFLVLCASRLGAAGSTAPLFLPVVTYASGGTGASSVAVADVNGDGVLDLAVANLYASSTDCSKGSVAVLLGNGDGTFQTAATYGSGGQGATSVAVGDLNGDGKPDLAVANAGSPQVGILLGNGDGTFQTVQRYTSGGFGTSSVAIADVNGDGKLDLAIVNCGTCGLQEAVAGVLLGNGDGTFEPVRTVPLQQYYSRSIAVADVNGDGKPDLVVSFSDRCGIVSVCGTGAVGVLFGNGDGTFQPVRMYNIGVYAVSVVAFADLNGNGRPDVVAGGSCLSFSPCRDLGVLLDNGDHTFQPAAVYGSGGVNVLSVAAGDVNGDGKPDLLVANECPFSDCFNETVVGVLLGNGDGTFQKAIAFGSGGFLAHGVALGDMNGDGRPDVVVANLCTGEFSCDNEDGTVSGLGLIGVLLNNTPFCTTPPVITVSTSAVSLWPPNGKMIPVTVSGTITDTGCSIKSASFAVTDEYVKVQPTGPITLGPSGNYSFDISLQASRLGTDTDGRGYNITVRAIDTAGKTGSNMSVVTVPHDQRH
jgi:hypothetical protein